MQRRRAVAAAGLLAALPAWSQQAGDAFDEEAAAQPAMPVTIHWPPLTLLDGTTVPPAAWDGIPVVVVFWATWCAFCQRHNTHVTALQRLLAERPGPPLLRLLGIAVDGDAATVRRTMLAHGHSFPVVAGQAGIRRQFTPRRTVPMTCLVDAAGRLRQCIPGEMEPADVLGLMALAWTRR